MRIYKNQKLETYFLDINSEDLSILTLRIDYWSPSNIFSTPTGSIVDEDITKSVDGDTSKISFTFEENILNESKTWKFQVVDVATNIPWDTKEFIVLPRG